MKEELPSTKRTTTSSSGNSTSIKLSPKTFAVLIALALLVISQFLIDIKSYATLYSSDYGIEEEGVIQMYNDVDQDTEADDYVNGLMDGENDNNRGDNGYDLLDLLKGGMDKLIYNSEEEEGENDENYYDHEKEDDQDSSIVQETDDSDSNSNNETNSSSTDTNTSISSSCPTFQNSKEWLTNPRHSNINEPLMTDEYIQKLILNISPLDTIDGSQDVLHQSLCLKDSAFMNWDSNPKIRRKSNVNSNNDVSEEDKIRLITVRLLFLAIHEHQYGSARLEAKMRYNTNNHQDETCVNEKKEYRSSLTNANVGKFDFECPNTKYLISHVPEAGFGASLRVGLMDPMFLGLVTGRVVLFVNSFDSHPDASFKKPWPLASCPRKDMQCVYMPLSPCVLTKEEIEKGIVLPNDNVVLARSTGSFGEEYDNAKVLMMKTSVGGHQQLPIGLWSKFVSIIESFYDKQQHDNELGSGAWQLDKETLTKVTSFLSQNSPVLTWLPHQVTGFYLMRPNMDSREKIDKSMSKILPENFDPKTTVGFPIRGKFFEEVFLLFHDYFYHVRL